MLGKNNFKERLRRMEEQNKKERFSIRKLSIGAASVLIGFAFMGLGAQTVQADQVTPSVKQEVKNAGDQAQEQKDSLKIDQPVTSTPEAEKQIATPKTGEVQKQATDKQIEATAKTEATKNDNSEQTKKPQAVDQNAKNVQTKAQDQTAKNDKQASTEQQAKQNSATAETHEGQKTTDQTTKADQLQNKTSKSESTTNNEQKANSEDLKLAKNDQVKDQQDQNKQVTAVDKTAIKDDKASAKADQTGTVNDVHVTSAADDLEAAMKKAMDLEDPTSGHKLTTDQVSQIDTILEKGQALLDRYHAAQVDGKKITSILRSNPTESGSTTGNSETEGHESQTFDPTQFAGIAGNLNQLISSLRVVPDANGAVDVGTWDDFSSAYQNNNVKTINLTGDINDTVLNGPVLKRDADLVVNGNNKTISVINTNGAANFYLNPNTTITFKNVKFDKTDCNKDQNQTPLFSAYTSYYRDQTVPVLNLNNATFKNVPIIVGTDSWNGSPTVSVNLGGDIKLDINTSYHLNNNVNTIIRSGYTWLAPLFSTWSDAGGVINVLANANVNTVDGSTLKVPFLGTGNINILGNINLKYDMRDVGSFFAQGDAGSAITVGGHAQVNIVGNNDTSSITSHPWTPHNVLDSTFKGKYAKFTVNDDAQVNLTLTGAKSSAAPVGLISNGTSIKGFHVNGNGTLNITSSLPIVSGMTFTSTPLVEGTGNSLIHLTDTSTNNDGILATVMGDYKITGTNVILQKDDGTFDAHKVRLANNNYIAVTDSNGKTKLFHISTLPSIYESSGNGHGLKYMNIYPTVDRTNEKFGSTTSAEDILREGLGTPLYQLSDQAEYNALADAGSYKRIAWGPRSDILIPTTDAGIYNATAATQVVHVDQQANLENAQNVINPYKDYFNPTQTVTPTDGTPTIKWVSGIVEDRNGNGFYNASASSAITPSSDGTTAKLNSNATNKTSSQLGNATIEITYADGSKDYVPVTINIKEAKAKPGSVTTPATTDSATNPIYPVDSSQPDGVKNPTAAAAKSVIDGTDISQWNPTYKFVGDDGRDLTSFPTDIDNVSVFADPTDSTHYKVVKTNVKVNYKNSAGADDGYQIVKDVYVRVKKTLADQFSAQIKPKTGLKVLEGANPTSDEALSFGSMTAEQKRNITISPTNDTTHHSITYTISFGHNGADGTLTRKVNYELVPKANPKTGLTFTSEGKLESNTSVTIANGNNKGEALLNWGTGTEPSGQNYSVSGLTYADNTNQYLNPGPQTATVQVQLANDVITTGATDITTDVSGHKSYAVPVPITVNGMNTQYANSTSVANGQHVTVHVVKNRVTGTQSYQDPITIPSFENQDKIDDLIKITGVDHSSSVIDHIEWASPLSATDQISNGDSSKFSNATLNVIFKDGSSLTTSHPALAAKVDVVGGVANTDSTKYVKFDSGSNLSQMDPDDLAFKAKGALTLASANSIDAASDNSAEYSWDPTDMPDTTYDATDPHHNSLDRQATVVITYHDYDLQGNEHNSVQKVKVHYLITPQADNFHGQITVNRGYVHMGEHMIDAQGPTQDQFNDSTLRVSDNGHTSTTVPSGWTWNGWMVKNSDGTFRNATDADLDYDNITLGNDGQHNVLNKFYASYKMSDNSVVHANRASTLVVAGGKITEEKAITDAHHNIVGQLKKDSNGDFELIHKISDTGRPEPKDLFSTNSIDLLKKFGGNPDYKFVKSKSSSLSEVIDTNSSIWNARNTGKQIYVQIMYPDSRGATLNFTYQYVPVKLVVQGIGDQISDVQGQQEISAHVVNTGDIASYVNGLINKNTTITYKDANNHSQAAALDNLGNGVVDHNGITWTTAPVVTNVTNNVNAVAHVKFNDGSATDVTFKVNVAGATAKTPNQSVTSMTQPDLDKAKAAVTGLPTGATVVGWVNATENGTHEYRIDHDVTDHPSFDTTWRAAHDSTTEHNSTSAFVKVQYTDAHGNKTYQIVPVTLNITSLADSGVGANYKAVDSTETHYGHTFTNEDAIPLVKNGNTALTANDVGEGKTVTSVAWVSAPNTNVSAADMSTGEHDLANQAITITFADGSTKTVDTIVKVHGGKSVADSSAATLNCGENLTTNAAKDVAKRLISNNSDLGSYNATYAWSTTDGPNVSASTNGRVEHAKVVISYFRDAAHTQADGTQVVEVPYKVQNETENPATRATINADGLKVHYGQQVSRDDAIGLVKIGNTVLTPSHVGTGQTVTDVQWVTSLTNGDTVTPDTKAATAGQADTDVAGFIKVAYSDGSSKILAAGIHVIGGYNDTDKTFTIVSGAKPTNAQAKEAIKNSASGVTDSLSGYNVQYSWAQDDRGTAMEDSYVTSATNTDKDAWVVITYTDGTGASAHVAKQVVKVNKLKITAQNNHYTPEVAPATVGQTSGIVTHVNAPAIDLTTAPIRFKYTDENGNTQYKSLSDIGATASWDGAVPDLTTAAAIHNYRIKITYHDHSVATPDLEMPVTVIGAKGQDVVFNKKSTNDAPSITDKDVDNKTAISNEGALSQFGATITWKKSDGTAIDWTKPTLNNDGEVEAVPVTVTVHYNDNTTQDVNLNLKINGSATIDASHYTAASDISVHYGQDISNDAVGLIKHDGTALTTANLANHGIQSIDWVSTPNTAVASNNGEHDLANQQIKITFTDGSVLTKDTTVKVFSGYNNADKNVTVVSGDVPTEQDAKDAIANWADLNAHHQATSVAWAKDTSGTAMDAAYVTSATNTDKDAWIKITYSDNKTQIVPVNALHVMTQATGYTIREVNVGLNSHAVDSGSPDVGDLKQYFTVTEGSTDESNKVRAASWVAGHVPTWTTAGDTSGKVHLEFVDGSSKDVDLNVHLVGINVPDTTESTYRNVVPTPTQAKAKVTNSTDLNPYHPTYDWYSDANATALLSDHPDIVANPGTKTVYLGVKYHKADGSDDGQQVKAITLTINNSSSQYRATNNTAHSSITTHVGAPAADFGDGSDYVTITKNDGSAVSASDIRSYEWTTQVDTGNNASGTQTAVVTITFADSTTAQPDTLTVNVPVTVVKATAKNNIETNHDAPLSANDQITNMNALNTNNFKVSDADVTWASDADGAALPANFWTTNSDSSTATDPETGATINGKKGAWLIVNYKKADGTTSDGKQAIWVPVKINSDADNIDSSNTNAYNADHGIYKTHIGAKINGAANFGNVHFGDQIGFRDSNDRPMFVDADGNPTWSFDGFAKANASGSGYSASDVDLDVAQLTNGKHDITDLYAKINLPDGSTTYVKMNHVYVYGGYEQKTVSSSTTTYPTSTNNGTALTDAEARTAIANNGDLAQFGDTRTPVKYEWSTGGVNDRITAPNVTYREGATGVEGTKLRTANVIITYGDGTKQAVEVHYNVKSDADSTNINTDPTDRTGKHITGDPILAHVSNDGAAENVDGADAIVVTEGTGSSAVRKTLSQIGASIAWDSSADMNTWVTSEHNAEWKDATITYSDGSTKAVQIKVKVVGASRKESTTAGQADVVTNHDVVPDAGRSINKPNATGAKWNIASVQWADASGNALSDADRTNFFAANTDGSSVTIGHTTYDKAKAGYVLVTYERNGHSDGTQLLEVPVQIKSEADNIDPNTGVTFNTAQGNVVQTHANATSAAPANSQIIITDNAGNNVSGWNFSNWSTKDAAGNYSDVSAADLVTDLNDHGLNADGVKDVNDVYAKITLVDGSTIYTPAMKIQVLGGVGQPKTYDHTSTVPAASEGVKNYNAVHDAFDHATYSWVTPDSSDPSGYTAFSDFNTRTHDADGNLAPNDNVYVKIDWGDGTSQYVKAPVTIKGDNDIYADDVTSNTQGLTFHVNTPDAEVLPDAGFTTNNIPSTIQVSYEWDTTGTGDEYGQPDISTDHLNNGAKTVTKNVKITFTNGSTTTSVIKPLTVHIVGGYAASEHQSVQAGEVPTADQAKDAIANNDTLSQFNKNNHHVTYEWFSDEDGTHALTDTDTQLTGATGSKNVYVKITYPKADGTSDGSQMVKVTLNLTNDLAHQYADQLSGKDITVVKSNTPLSGTDHAQEAVNVPTRMPEGTTYAWNTPVNISTTGDKAGVVNVKFSDNSVVQVATIVHVVDHTETIADRTPVNGGEIWVASGTQLDESHGAEQAKAGISNSASLPAGTTYNWTAPVNTSTPGSEVAGIVKVTFTDGSFKNAGVVVHVRGIAPSGNQASRFVPQGNDLTKNLNDTVTVDDAKAGIRNKATDTAIPADRRLPGDVQITWASDVNGITSTTGDKAAIVKVTYSDDSVDEVPIIIHVRDNSDASHSVDPSGHRVEPLGQDIYKHNGETLTNTDAENAITNHADLANVHGYEFENNPVPMDSTGHINIEGSSAVYGANVKITYNDNSFKLVPIFIHVTKDNSTTPSTGYNRDSDNINPFGKTIDKDMSQTAVLSDGAYSSTTTHPTDAQNAVGFPTSTDMSKVGSLTWADSNFKNNALKSEGLKAGVVKVTYADGSFDMVNVQVRVTSEATRTHLTAKTIYRNYQDSRVVNAEDGIVEAIPARSTAEFVSPVNLDSTGHVINAGTYGETIKVTFHDGSSTILNTSLVVGADNQSEAEAYTPVGGLIVKYVGDTLNDDDAKAAINNSNSLPGDATYNWTTPDSAHLKLTTAGLKNGVVNVTFQDGSHKDVNVLIDVRSMADNPAYAPIGQTVHISTPNSTPLTGVGSGEGAAQNGIANAAALANVVASPTATTHPADPFTWVGSIDISHAGTTAGIIKVSYKDGSSRNVAVNVVVGDQSTTPITGAIPRAQVIEGHYGDVFDNNEENAKKGIANTTDMPAGTTYRFEDASELPVDATTHKLNQEGNNPVIIIVTDAQGHEKRVATVIHVVSDASLDTTTPIGQNITTTVGDPDHKVTPENGIANRNDLHHVATTGGYTWDGATPAVSTTGTKPAVVKITYADGSFKIVPISVIVNDTTPSTNPNQPIDPGHPTDADAVTPFGKTIEKDMSQTAALTDGDFNSNSDAKNAVGFPEGTDTTKIGSLTWVDPNFKADALKHSGYHAGQVRVTYADGSSDIVTALVHVISMADRYNPTPRPVQVDPTNPSQPTDPSDPHNPTPGVDPSTVPGGTHTGWPTDPSGHPVIPDHTPGTHPGQIEIHYPDGSHTILPVPVVNPSDRDTHHPTPRPIPVTPGENPSDITNPTPAEPTPGVDPSSVAPGSHTILDPSQPAPDTTTPGTHPVHVIVVYPDGSQSDPIPTNIVVPDNGNHNVPEPTPEPVEPVEPTVNVETQPTEPAPQTPATVTTRISFSDGQREIAGLPITGKEGETIPLAKIQAIVKDNMPKGYVLDMDLEQAWKDGKFVITAKHPITIKIAKVRRQLVLFVDKRGRIVGRAYIQVKVKDQLTKDLLRDLTGKHMPKGYKMTGYKKVAKHIDIFVSGKKTKATSHGKLVLYVRKDGKIIKKLNIKLVKGKFNKRNAKMHLPKGYKMTGHTHINRHNDVWVVKK